MSRQRLRFVLNPEEINTLIDEQNSANTTKFIISGLSVLKHFVVNPEGKLRNGIWHQRKYAGIPKDCLWWIEKLERGTYAKRIMISLKYYLQKDSLKIESLIS